jgi:hypothetical protein
MTYRECFSELGITVSYEPVEMSRYFWNAAVERAAKVADLESNCGDDRHGNTVSAAIRALKETP